MDFEYEPLPENHIRLFRYHDQSDGTLVGRLATFSLSKSFFISNLPWYYTLSYVWGNSTYGSSVLIKDKRLPILDSVHTFLKQDLLHQGQNWWWIDSICINQNDEHEKAEQVVLMGQIFARSQQTWAWLGEASADSDRAINFLEWIAKQTFGSRRGHTEDPEVVEMRRKDGPHLLDWKAVNALLSRPWWTRVWTVQEFVVAKQARLCCGASSISRKAFQRALDHIYDAGVDLDSTAPWNRNRVSSHYNQWKLVKLGLDAPSLVATLAYLSDHESTDARDRVYSLYGIVRDSELAGKPEYGQAVEDLYTRLAKSFIEKYDSLDIICLATVFKDFEETRPMLPSWVPDWRVKTFPLVVPTMASQGDKHKIDNLRPWSRTGNSWDPYNASGQSLATVSFNLANELTCTGVMLSTVDGMSGMAETNWQRQLRDGYELVQPRGYQITQANHSQSASIGVVDIMKAIVRCLVLDRGTHYLSFQMIVDDFLEEFATLLSWTKEGSSDFAMFVAWYTRNTDLQILNMKLGVWTDELLDRVQPLAELPEPFRRSTFYSRFHDTIVKMERRLAILADGTLATVPRRTRQNDVVCVLLGCSIPVVLRECDGGGAYSLIGEAYVDGYMDGQALENGSTQEFKLI